jgi:hypothetical protein
MQNNKNKQKGAMFGLDARIALAIFASLSVISGAALYKVIQDVSLTSVYLDAQEVAKASETFLLDTGLHIPIKDGFVAQISLGDTVENRQNLPGWKGPYLPYSRYDQNLLWYKYKGQTVGMMLRKRAGETWAADLTGWPRSCAVANENCYEWITINVTTIPELFSALDNKYDNADGPHAGEIRYRELNASAHMLYIKGRVRGVKDEN